MMGVQSGRCLNPADVTWLAASPMNGTVIPGGTQQISIYFDSSGLSGGVYTATLCLKNNDLTDSLISIPVTLTTTGNIVYLPFVAGNVTPVEVRTSSSVP